jgi:hypothetical protein
MFPPYGSPGYFRVRSITEQGGGLYFPAVWLAGVHAFMHSWKQILYYFREKVASFLFKK